MSVRFKVVGRREEPIQRPVASTAPGAPQQTEWTTAASLLLMPVDADGNPLASTGGGGMAGPGGGAQTMIVPATSLADIEGYITGQFYNLTPE